MALNSKCHTLAETAAMHLSREGVLLVPVLGVAGVGKGYVLERVQVALLKSGIGVLSSSRCLKEAAKDIQHPLYCEAATAQEDIVRGRLVSDELTSAIVLRGAINQLHSHRQLFGGDLRFLIVDGFPRTPRQAWYAYPALHACIHLQGDDEAVLEANMIRRLGEQGRSDDQTEEVRRRRIHDQKRQLAELLPVLNEFSFTNGRNGKFLRSVPAEAVDGEKVRCFVRALPLAETEITAILNNVFPAARPVQLGVDGLNDRRPARQFKLAATTVVPA